MTKNFRALAFLDFYGRPSMNAGEIGTFNPDDDGFKVLIERGLIEVLPDTVETAPVSEPETAPTDAEVVEEVKVVRTAKQTAKKTTAKKVAPKA